MNEKNVDSAIKKVEQENCQYCLNCGKQIISGDYKRKKFCNSSCAASYNNKKRRKKENIEAERQKKEKLDNVLKKIDKTIIREKRSISGNKKTIGERGERITIGELAKFDINVLQPMGDNLPFDLVVYHNNKFFKCQIKTSNTTSKNESIRFNLTSNNWYAKTTHKYSKDEVDVFILCDLNNIYLFKFEELEGKGIISLRNTMTKSNQVSLIHFASDYIISDKRIEEVFN